MKTVAVDFDTAAKKADKNSMGGRKTLHRYKARKVWAEIQAGTRAGLGWGIPVAQKVAE